ncbi:Rpn family recombination-promoting nuclease/putative transposase [Arcicella rigui]|uniref:Rpn family recombination-promoting nuclease/putative transposase n=1 Tax=Arcicella rigui TaxID=797020 RepID=A0ABU5QFJ2_9BACT|nr:Rpn family recombination-promoting nuclease/putative transposase [Arcicella rigui]MEA5141640.1 Rpn family recombination-promoting nuclease/putative transposase [Arcicella rigui]
MAKYINPYTDFGFKKLFGEEGNKDLLIDFLNQLLPPHHQIADLNFRNPENLADFSTERKAIFDIHCKALSGEKFIVEMQKAKVKYFKDRSLFYVTFPIREQAQQGEWNFRLEPIYFVAILDFEYDEAEEIRKFRRDVSLKDQDGDIFFDKLHFKFLQMPLFNKKENELATKFDKWCYFLKNLESFDHIPNILNEPIFQKAFGTAELANLSVEQRAIYEENLIQYWGMKSALETAVEEREIEIAKKLIKRRLTNEEIAEDTGLSIEQIQELRNKTRKN